MLFSYQKDAPIKYKASWAIYRLCRWTSIIVMCWNKAYTVYYLFTGCVYGNEFIKGVLKKRFQCFEPKTILHSGIKTATKLNASLYDRFFREREPEPFAVKLKRGVKYFFLIMFLILLTFLPSHLFVSSNYCKYSLSYLYNFFRPRHLQSKTFIIFFQFHLNSIDENLADWLSAL